MKGPCLFFSEIEDQSVVLITSLHEKIVRVDGILTYVITLRKSPLRLKCYSTTGSKINERFDHAAFLFHYVFESMKLGKV